jgi:hypothetical protein
MGAPQVLSEDSYPFLTIAQGVLNNPDYAFCTRKCPANPTPPSKTNPDRSPPANHGFDLPISTPSVIPTEAKWRDLQRALRPSEILPRHARCGEAP